LQTTGIRAATCFIGVVAFRRVGYVACRYGQQMLLQTTRWIGIALMFYPYLVSTTWLLSSVGLSLCIGALPSSASA
jgi:hypothetical protein